jgi:hypothetical protein
VSTKEGVHSAGDEAGQVGDEIGGNVDGDRLAGDTEREPQQEQRLVFSTKAAAGGSEPLGQGSADLNSEGGGVGTLGAGSEGRDDDLLDISQDISLEDGSKGHLGRLDQNTSLANQALDGGTGGDDGQTAGGQRAERNSITLSLAVQPSKHRDLQGGSQRAVAAIEPLKQRNPDLCGEIRSDTTAGTEAKTSLDLGVEQGANGSLKERSKGRLSSSRKDNVGHEFSSIENTIQGHNKLALSRLVRTGGDEHRQDRGDIDRQDGLVTAITPTQDRLHHGDVENTRVGVEPLSQFLTGAGTDRAGLASQRTTLQSGGCLSADAAQKGGRARTTTEEQIDNTSHVADQLGHETGAAVQVGGESESVARQAGEQQKVVRTHCGRKVNNIQSECSG